MILFPIHFFSWPPLRPPSFMSPRFIGQPRGLFYWWNPSKLKPGSGF
jgi:hypothetical protein